jgi:hypothetical protein
MNKQIFNDVFCDDMEGFGTEFLDSYISTLFHEPAVETIKCRYKQIIDCFNEGEWSKPQFIPVEQIRDTTLPGKKNIGIDLPVWFNSSSKNTRIMLVAMEPKRNKDTSKDGYASLATPFALDCLKVIKNRPSFYLFYNFIGGLLENDHAVYVTDIRKTYSITERRVKHHGDSKLNESLFSLELQCFKPDVIITFGIDVKPAVDRVIENCGYDLVTPATYFPHPASRVKRDYEARLKQCLEEYRAARSKLAYSF